MITQIEFEKTVTLLSQHRQEFPTIENILNSVNNSVIAFFTLADNNSPGTLRENIIEIYRLEAEMQSRQYHISHELDYDTLLQRLESTEKSNIAITEFITDQCTYKVFSDLERKELYGILKSNATLQQEQEKVENLKRLMSVVNTSVEIDNSRIKHLFRKGKYETESI